MANTSLPLDRTDFFVLQLKTGDHLFIRVETLGTLPGCIHPRLYRPSGEEMTVGTACSNGESFMYQTVLPETGSWYVEFPWTPTFANSGRTPYTFEVLVVSLSGGAAHRFEDQAWVAARIGPGLRDFHVQMVVDDAVDSLGVTRFFLVRDDGVFFNCGDIGYASGFTGILEPTFAAQFGSTRLRQETTSVDAPEILPRFSSCLTYAHYPGQESDAFIFLGYFEKPTSGWLALGYEGTYEPRLAAGPEIVAYRMSDFDAQIMVQTPAGGLVAAAALQYQMPKRFVGQFSLSTPLLQLDEQAIGVSEGGFVDPSGRTVELSAEEPQVVLVYPESGGWAFWFRKDAGANGQPMLLEGVPLPSELFTET